MDFKVLSRQGKRAVWAIVMAGGLIGLAACGGGDEKDAATQAGAGAGTGGGASQATNPGDPGGGSGDPGTNPADPGNCAALLSNGQAFASVAGVRNLSAGAACIGTTEYPVPPDAIFVSPAGSDAADGSLAAPYATVQRALEKATSGATIVLRAGVYHEEKLDIHGIGNLTIQSYPREAVWFDGSTPVSAWAPVDLAGRRLWVSENWSKVFGHHPTDDLNVPDGTGPWQFVNPTYPMAPYPDQMWIDGVAQVQAASLDKVVAGSFFHDEIEHKLYLGSDPAGRHVRASDLSYAITNQGVGTVFRGFGVRRYGTGVPEHGAIRTFDAQGGVTFENIVFSENATTGVHIGNTPDAKLLHVTTVRNGLSGAGMNRTDRLRVEGLLSAENNQEHFNIAPVSAGLKSTHTRDAEVRDSVFLNNLAHGLWFDESVYDMKVFNNDVIGNAGSGIFVEISAKALLANNLVAGNQESGILIDGSSDVEVWNNTLVNNGNRGPVRNLNMGMGTRRWSDTSQPGRDDRAPSLAGVMTWITGPVKARNNIIAGGPGNCLVCVEDHSNEFTPEQMGISMDHNLYRRTPAGEPVFFTVWSRGSAQRPSPADPNPTVYFSLEAFRTATGQETNGLALEGAQVVDAQYRLLPALSAQAGAVSAPLPADIAARIGQPAGARQMGAWR